MSIALPFPLIEMRYVRVNGDLAAEYRDPTSLGGRSSLVYLEGDHLDRFREAPAEKLKPADASLVVGTVPRSKNSRFSQPGVFLRGVFDGLLHFLLELL